MLSLVARGMLGSALRAWGYEVVEATDGNEAWRILQSSWTWFFTVIGELPKRADTPKFCGTPPIKNPGS